MIIKNIKKPHKVFANWQFVYISFQNHVQLSFQLSTAAFSSISFKAKWQDYHSLNPLFIPK